MRGALPEEIALFKKIRDLTASSCPLCQQPLANGWWCLSCKDTKDNLIYRNANLKYWAEWEAGKLHNIIGNFFKKLFNR